MSLAYDRLMKAMIGDHTKDDYTNALDIVGKLDLTECHKHKDCTTCPFGKKMPSGEWECISSAYRKVALKIIEDLKQ